MYTAVGGWNGRHSPSPNLTPSTGMGKGEGSWRPTTQVCTVQCVIGGGLPATDHHRPSAHPAALSGLLLPCHCGVPAGVSGGAGWTNKRREPHSRPDRSSHPSGAKDPPSSSSTPGFNPLRSHLRIITMGKHGLKSGGGVPSLGGNGSRMPLTHAVFGVKMAVMERYWAAVVHRSNAPTARAGCCASIAAK